MKRLARILPLVLLAALAACKDSASVRTWSVTWSAAVEGGTGRIDSLTWREHTSPYSRTGPMTSWFWTAPLPAGQQVFLRVRGSTTSPALIRASINATASDHAPFGSELTCSGADTYCQIGPLTLP